MRKLKLMKTLLMVATLLVGGANFAWGTDVPYNVGTSTSDTWGKGFSDVWTMTGDGAVTVTFTNHCVTTGNWWENWYLLCGNSDYTPTAHEDANRYFQMRSDRWDDAAASNVGFIVSDDYFTDFMTFQNEATVTLKIVRSGTTVTVNTSVTKSTTTRTMTFVKTGLSGTLNFFLTQNLSYMQITQQSKTTEMAGTVTCNALVNFDNFTSEKTEDKEDAAPASATGGKGTMSTSNAFQYKVDAGSYRLGLRNGANTIAINSSEYAGSKDIITISFDMALSQMNGSGKTSYFYLQDANNADIARVTMEATNNSWTEENHYLSRYVDNTLGLENGDIDYAWSSEDWGKKVHFTITLNYLTGKITTTTACATANNTTSSHTVDMTNTNPVAKFVVGAAYNVDYRKYRCQFDNLLIQTEKGDYNTTANITLTFKDDEDNDISALYTGTSAFTPEKGSTFKPSDYYPTVMYDDDYKYTYTSGGDDFVVSVDKEVELVYTKSTRPTYTYNVTANYGAKSKKIVDAVSVKEAADYTYYYPRFILDGTTLYEYASSTDGNASANYWTSTNTNVSADANYTLTYNAIDGECVYYSEGEDVTDAVGYRYSGFRTAMSNGSTGFLEAANLTSLDAGVYTVTARGVGRASGRYVRIYKESASDENKILEFLMSNAGTEQSATFALTENTDIIASAGYNTTTDNGGGCDYVYIMKLPSTVSASLGSNGYGTFASAYALNLTTASLPSGVSAYKASVSGTTVTFTELNQTVPANTGILLKGAASATVSIPVAAAGTAVEGNAFLVNTAGTTFTGDNDYYYFGLMKNTLTFGLFDPNELAIPADKAYLKVLKSSIDESLSRSLSVIFGDETGISQVENGAVKTVDAIFDLQGRRVAQPQKGLYIVNGKKVIMK